LRRLLASICALSLGAAYACSADDAASPTTDGGADTSADVTTDAAPDAGDASADADAEPTCAPFVPPAGCAFDGGLSDRLECTGLYEDFARRTLACGVREFEPGFVLWSDGAAKRRFVYLPPGATIGADDPDQWFFPPGTKLWKEFSIALPDGGMAVIETRLFSKQQDGTWRWTTYVWSDDGAMAVRTDNGVKNVRGTTYEIPSQQDCAKCHDGRIDKVLGFDSILMAAPEAKGLVYAELLAKGKLAASPAPPAASALQIPGTPAERAALGYLHANCGVACHNASAASGANQSGLHMKLVAANLARAVGTDTVTTGANKRPGGNFPNQPPPPDGGWFAIHPGDLSRSLLPTRMATRDVTDGGRGQMPPFITHVVDDAGVATVSAWISGMTVDAGYPAPAP